MPIREQPLLLRILLNICGPLGMALALFGYLNAALGLGFLVGTVLYVGWELYPSASVFVRRRMLLSLPVFLFTGLLVGLCAWVLVLKMPHVPSSLQQSEKPAVPPPVIEASSTMWPGGLPINIAPRTTAHILMVSDLLPEI